MKKDLKALLQYVLLFFCLIVYWEILLFLVSHGSLRSMRGWFALFALPQALILASLCGWGRDRADRALAALLALALFVFYCAHLIYYLIFGSMISLSMAGMGGAAMAGFGWTMTSTLRESAGRLLAAALPVLPTIGWIFVKKPAAGKLRLLLRPAGIAAAALLWLLAGRALLLGGTGDASAYHAYASSFVDTDTAAARLGVLTTSELELRSMLLGGGETETADALSAAELPEELILPAPDPAEEAELPEERETEPLRHENPAFDFTALAEAAESETVAGLCRYFASVRGSGLNAQTGRLKDCNLIYICAEGFCSMALSEEVTPTLYRMANEGVVLTNYYNSYRNTTTNGEYAMLTGLWPDVSRKADMGETTGSFGQSATHYMPYGPGNLFRELGVNSYAYHNYVGSYYGRNRTHANLGYACKFSGDMRFTDTWPASDLQMMEQSVDDYIHEERFNVYYMTFSGHGPYNLSNNDICRRNFSLVPETADGRALTTHARCYLASALELEWSMQYLMERLAEAGKLDNTLIVIAGDHYPYYLSDEAAASLQGGLPEKDFERYRSTCIMWCGALEEPIVCDVPCCNVDILPTVLNLLGIEFDSRLLSGTDVFSDSLHAAMLYNRSFITDRVKYNAVTGELVSLDPDVPSDREELKVYADNVSRVLGARYAAALSVNKTDFYRFVWENAGLMPEG